MEFSQKHKYILIACVSVVVLFLCTLLIFVYFHNKPKTQDVSIVTNTATSTDDNSKFDIAKLNTNGNITKSFDSGNFSQLNDILDYRLSINGHDVDTLVKKSLSLSQQGSLQYKENEFGNQAIVFSKLAISIDPKSADAQRSLGYAYEIMQNYVEAQKAYSAALKINPNDVPTLFQIGHVYDLKGDNTNAQTFYERALFIDPNNQKALLGMGRIYVAKKDYKKALENFKQVANLAKNSRLSAGANYSIGTVQGYLGNWEESLKSMRVAVAKDPTYDSAWLGLATILFNVSISTSTNITTDQKRADAVESFDALNKALKINPNLFGAYYQLGTQMVIMGKNREAITFFNSAKSVLDNDITLSQRDKYQNSFLVDAALKLAIKNNNKK